MGSSADGVSAAMVGLGTRARLAARVLANTTTTAKNEALLAAADLLEERASDVLAANATDVGRAESAGTPPTVVDRLRLTATRVAGMAAGLRQVAGLPDPVGEVLDGGVRPNGLRIRR